MKVICNEIEKELIEKAMTIIVCYECPEAVRNECNSEIFELCSKDIEFEIIA